MNYAVLYSDRGGGETTVATIFALAAAVLYGSADFLGGTASRRAHTLAVLAVSAPFGVLVMVVAALAAGGPLQLGSGLAWAAAGGMMGGGGLIVFYQGLARGPMSVVAPVSALVSTLLPVGVAAAWGERQAPGVYAGALVCLAAIVLISLEGRRPGQPRGWRGTAPALGYGVAAGISFGLFFLFLRNAGQSGVFWPVTAARVGGGAVVLAAVAWTGIRPRWQGTPPRILAAAVLSGVTDAVANVCYVLATRAGLFGMAVILTSLYPGITVLLARFVLGERMRLVQRLGLVLAAAGVALVTL
jgi:drug/metabolite transporter (DMT)-like permease